MVTVPENFEVGIISLENTKDLSKFSLTELINALQAQEQRRVIRDEDFVEGALQAKLQLNQREKTSGRNTRRRTSTPKMPPSTIT